MIWELAPDLQKKVVKLVSALKYFHIDPKRVIVFRSFGSKARARARIWSLPRIWQQALEVEPHYCLEVISERFDRLHPRQQEEILIHELRHIPSNFSGSLLPHGRMRKK
jgi:predicted metallopeptidase